MVDVPGAAAIQALHTGAEVDRANLVAVLSASRVERQKLGAAQRKCPDLAAYYVVHLAWGAYRGGARARDLQRAMPGALGKRKIDTVREGATQFELPEGALFWKVCDVVSGEMQLRCCVPDVPCGIFEMPGKGVVPLGYRERVLLEHLNGPTAGHPGRERTMGALERDFWWPGMYADVRKWCCYCQHCAGERASAGVSAWTLTGLYSRPLRLIQCDLLECRDPGAVGNPTC